MSKFIKIASDNNKIILLNIYSIAHIKPNTNGFTVNAVDKILKYDISNYIITKNDGEQTVIKKETYKKICEILKEKDDVKEIVEKAEPISEAHFNLIKNMGVNNETR